MAQALVLAALAFAASDARVASSRASRAVVAVDGKSWRSQMTFTGHESDINSVHFLGNGHSIASGSDDSSCRIWDTRACQDIFALLAPELRARAEERAVPPWLRRVS